MERPGICKQDIVRYAEEENIASRIPILNDLDELEAKEWIIVKKDKPRSQICKLYINNENMFSSTLAELEYFKVTFLRFLEASNKKLKELESIRKRIHRVSIDQRAKVEEIELDILVHISYVYGYLIDALVGRALFKWPETVHDSDTLSKLYELVFTRLREILFEFQSVMFTNLKNKKSYMMSLTNSFMLDNEEMNSTFASFKHYGLDKQFEPVRKALLKISTGH